MKKSPHWRRCLVSLSGHSPGMMSCVVSVVSLDDPFDMTIGVDLDKKLQTKQIYME